MGKQKEVDALVGVRLGNYEIEAFIEKGGMGSVYRAVHPELGKKAAVKVLSKEVADTGNATDRFVVEAKLVARIDHRNVINVFDFGKLDDGRLYYTMEYVKGQTLTEILETRGRLPPAEVISYLEPICAALQVAHDMGVVHRDLKPDNIMVIGDDPRELRVLDFGIAKLLESTDTDSLNTTMGTVMGTPLFIAPEQAGGQIDRICPATDLYSLGVILYLMLSGETPFFDKAVGILMAMHIKDAPPLLLDKAPDVPPGIARLVHRCLAKAPEDRPTSAREIADVYAALLDGAEAVADNTSPGADEKQEQRFDVTGPTIAAPTTRSLSAKKPKEVAETTMGRSTGEMTDKVVGRSSGIARLAMAMGAAVLLAVVAYFAWPTRPVPQISRAPRVATAAPLSGSPPKKAAPKKPPPAGPQRKVKVKVVGGAASCQLRAGQGAAIKKSAPCEYQVPNDAKVTLQVTSSGLKPYEQSFTAGADLSIALQIDSAKKRLVRASEAHSDAPAKHAAPAVAEKQPPKKKRKKRRKRRGKTSKPAPQTPAKKPPTDKKRSPIGEGVMNID